MVSRLAESEESSSVAGSQCEGTRQDPGRSSETKIGERYQLKGSAFARWCAEKELKQNGQEEAR